MEILDTYDGRLAFKIALENMGLTHLNICELMSSLNYEDSLKRLLN
jgi:hypothetical protein